MLSSLRGLCVILPFLVFSPFSFSAIFFSRLEDVASWLAGGNVRVSGFEAGLAVFICAHRVVLGSFVFLFCLSSVFVRTAGCLSPSPSLVLAEALHVGFFFNFFSSYSFRFFCQFGFPCDVASCRLEFYKSRLSVCTVCRWLELGGYVQCDTYFGQSFVNPQ